MATYNAAANTWPQLVENAFGHAAELLQRMIGLVSVPGVQFNAYRENTTTGEKHPLAIEERAAIIRRDWSLARAVFGQCSFDFDRLAPLIEFARVELPPIETPPHWFHTGAERCERDGRQFATSWDALRDAFESLEYWGYSLPAHFAAAVAVSRKTESEREADELGTLKSWEALSRSPSPFPVVIQQAIANRLRGERVLILNKLAGGIDRLIPPPPCDIFDAVATEIPTEWDEIDRATCKLTEERIGEFEKLDRNCVAMFGRTFDQLKELRKRRAGGRTSPDKTLGIDGAGQIWRKRTVTAKTLFYVRDTITPPADDAD
ncbi:hypothetical protein TBK1r_50750 [Stieleria magnilauensis]|uniref:Uncharacterized protein n=1 Tax=Stieleria magnilauensis TaxID=2527963 RepID=A0ABX5XWX4_9BACT|nr:hypothetical protein TBK1r_50750 [Planctomycetes bacterium TBK1r]